MKQSAAILALGAPLAVLAQPYLQHMHLHDKRAIVTKTVHVKTTTTIDVTVTVYGPPPKDQQAVVAPAKPQENEAKPTFVSDSDDKSKYNPAPVQKVAVHHPAQLQEENSEKGFPKHEAPKQEAPKQEAPKQEAPKQEAPKQEAPKQEAPKQEAPKQEVQQQPTLQQTPVNQQAQSQNDDLKGQKGGSPSGGSCGQVGGKCMASDVTIYNDQGAGACGWSNDTNSEDYFALAIGTFGTYSNDMPGPHKNAFCGRTAMISVNGKTFEGTLTDACGGCKDWSIDLSLSLWNKVYPGGELTRKHNVEWWFTGPEIYHGPGA